MNSLNKIMISYLLAEVSKVSRINPLLVFTNYCKTGDWLANLLNVSRVLLTFIFRKIKDLVLMLAIYILSLILYIYYTCVGVYVRICKPITLLVFTNPLTGSYIPTQPTTINNTGLI